MPTVSPAGVSAVAVRKARTTRDATKLDLVEALDDILERWKWDDLGPEWGRNWLLARARNQQQRLARCGCGVILSREGDTATDDAPPTLQTARPATPPCACRTSCPLRKHRARGALGTRWDRR